MIDPLDIDKTMVKSGGGSGNSSLQPGSTLGQYRVLKLLGCGGMGEVYEVEHLQMHKKYALKVLPAEATGSGTFLDRFRVEARVMADLEQSNIVHVNYMGEEQGLFYLVMDYIEGPDGVPHTLEDMLEQQGKLPESQVKKFALQICSALEYAHGHDVVHRDIKPSNILLDANGNIKITDFGLVKVVGNEYLQSVIENSIKLSMVGQLSMGEDRTVSGSTTTGRPTSSARALLGTYDYMAPEQKSGGEITPRTDIFAFGIVLYRMLTGRKPEGAYRPPSFFGVSKRWDIIVQKCMEHEPTDRYADGGELKKELRNVRKARKSGLKLLVVSMLIMGVVGGLWFMAGRGDKNEPQINTDETLIEKINYETGEKRERTDETETLRSSVQKQTSNEKPQKTLTEVAELRSEAEYNWEQVKAYDSGQGIDKKLKSIEIKLNAARIVFDKGSYAEAEKQYKAVLEGCKEVKNINEQRSKADTSKTEMELTRNAAKEAKADELVFSYWSTAKKLEKEGDKKYDKGNFNGAVTDWQRAEKQYKTAGDKVPEAREREARKKAIAEYERVIKEAEQRRKEFEHKLAKGAKAGDLKEDMEKVLNHLSGLSTAYLSTNQKKQITNYEKYITALLAKLGPQQGDILTLDLGRGVKMEFVWIEAGEFMMGSNEYSDEKPIHKVKISKGFWMGKYEVTQRQYQQITGNNPSYFKKSGMDAPVEQVSWNDAKEFCSKLSSKTGRTVGLPTEAEWEYACRAGSRTRYSFGDYDNELEDYAWYDDNSGNKPYPVGQKKPNRFGLYDMHGNVWEWCEDRYGGDYYSKSPLTDPKGPSSGSSRVLRGASWGNDAWACRSALRFIVAPSGSSSIGGFRVVIVS